MKVETFTSAILSKMSDVRKVQAKFFLAMTSLFLSLRGRSTFLNFARYGSMNELSYRLNFDKCFDFKGFNRQLVSRYCSKDLVWVHLSKSGKHTPGVGYFWSGCAGKMKRGLEICGLAIADLANHTALHYHAAQTDVFKGEQNLLSFYAQMLVEQAKELKRVSATLAVDAFFSKRTFVDAICGEQMTVVSHLRSGSYLRYQFRGAQKGGHGRRKI